MDELDIRWQRRFDAGKRRLALKERAIAYKGGKCQECGYSRCPSALEFHHPNPREKEFHPSSKKSWDVLKAELDKCVLLCANCHREVHAGWLPQWLDAEADFLDYESEVLDRAE